MYIYSRYIFNMHKATQIKFILKQIFKKWRFYKDYKKKGKITNDKEKKF